MAGRGLREHLSQHLQFSRCMTEARREEGTGQRSANPDAPRQPVPALPDRSAE